MSFTVRTAWAENNGIDTATVTLTIAGVQTNDLIIAFATWIDATVTLSSMTADGNAMTHVTGSPLDHNNPGDYNTALAYYIATATKSHDIVVTLSGAPGTSNVYVAGAAFNPSNNNAAFHGADTDDKASGSVLIALSGVPDASLVCTKASSQGGEPTVPSGHTGFAHTNLFWWDEISYVLSTTADNHQWGGTSGATGGIGAAFTDTAAGGGIEIFRRRIEGY